MGFFQKLSKSADLVSGMAKRLDVDLSARIESAPDVEAAKFLNLVRRCSTCSDQEGCARLQDENPMLDAAPEFCRNRDVLQRV